MDQTHKSEEQLAAEVLALRARLSECRQAEEALRQELHLLHAVTQGNQDAVFVKDRQGRYLMINSAGARLIGRTVEEVIGKDDHQLFAPDSASRLIETDRQVMASGETLPHEEVATAAGVTRHYLVTKVPYRDPQGRIVGVVGIARDVTERKRVEALLQHSEERLRHVLEGSRDGVYQLNLLTGTYDYVSPALEEIAGYPADELIAGGVGLVTARTHPEDLERLREHVNRLLARTVEEAVDPTIEYRFHTKHLGYRWISDSRAVLFDQGHVPVAIIGNVRDVTERKQAEEERARLIREQAAREQAEQAQRRYHDLVQGLDAIVCEADAQTWQFTFVSRRAEAILGYPVERWLAEPEFWVHLIHPEDRERTVGWCRSATAEGRDHECEYRTVAADGRVVWLRDQVRVVRDDGGKVQQLCCLMTDVTARRGMEDALRDREARLRLMVEQNPAILWTTDTSLRITSSVGAGLAALHQRPDQDVGMTLFERLRTSDPECPPIVAHLRALRGEPTSYETEWAGFVYQGRLEPLRDGQGHVVGCIGIALDVTDRKRVEEALRESSRFNQQIIHSAQEGVAVLDRALRFTVWNPYLVELSGLPAQEVLGKPLLELFPFVREQGVDTLLERALAGETIPTPDLPYAVPQTGRSGWGAAKFQPLRDAKGAIIGVLAMVHEITERKRAESKLREYAERLQTLSRRILEVQEAERRYVGRELHDEIGQFLTGLNLTLEAGGKLPAEEFRGTLRRSQAVVQELVGRVRDLSLRLRPTMLDDLGLLPALLWHIDRYTRQTNVSVDFRHTGADRRFAPEVETAAYRIVQEALTNAARHAGVQEVTVGLWADQDRLMVQVEDRGTGFDAEAALAAQDSSGLAGMRERAMLLGGELRVDSAAGSGTCVTAELPLGGQSQRPGAPEESGQAERSGDHTEDGR